MKEETRMHVGGKKKCRSHHRRRFHEHMIFLLLKKLHESAPHLKKKNSHNPKEKRGSGCMSVWRLIFHILDVCFTFFDLMGTI